MVRAKTGVDGCLYFNGSTCSISGSSANRRTMRVLLADGVTIADTWDLGCSLEEVVDEQDVSATATTWLRAG